MSATAFHELRSQYRQPDLPPHKNWINLNDAHSDALRNLSRDLIVRNDRTLRDRVPTQCLESVDRFCSYLDKNDFASLTETVGSYLDARALYVQLGSMSLGEEAATKLFPIPEVNHNAIVGQLLGRYALRRFGSVNSLHLQALSSVPIERGMPSEPAQRDRAVFRLMTAAILDLEDGVALDESLPVQVFTGGQQNAKIAFRFY